MISMAKRRLTRHQQWRIEKIQQERTARANQRDVKLQEDLVGVTLVKSSLG